MKTSPRAWTTVVGVAALIVSTSVAGVRAQEAWKAPADAKNLNNPQPTTPDSVANGKKLAAKSCASCHGATGKGDGPAAKALKPPKPQDWASSQVKGETDGELFWKTTNGRGTMPPYKHLPEKDRWDLVNYIRSLQK
jgi:mono/diheme cytochrome c family protein